LLGFCLLALVVGVFNAVQLGQLGQGTAAHRAEEKKVPGLLNTKPYLALIELSGVITMDLEKEGGLFQSESDAVSVRKALDAAAKDDRVKGVLLRINSPGGTVAMSQELNAAVKRVSRRKPVVVSMGDLAASGGYYTACAADRIFANPGTLTASIGVIISGFDASRLITQKLGIEPVTLKSGKFKDVLSPYRPPTAEDKALVQRLINESYQDFLRAVLEGRARLLSDVKARPALAGRIKAVADGRVLTGTQAKAAGLVDEIGDQDAAYTFLDRAAKARFHLRDRERLPLEAMEEGFSIFNLLGRNAGVRGGNNPLSSLADTLPVSLRYPNQPLWVME
jgi:protease-4